MSALGLPRGYLDYDPFIATTTIQAGEREGQLTLRSNGNVNTFLAVTDNGVGVGGPFVAQGATFNGDITGAADASFAGTVTYGALNPPITGATFFPLYAAFPRNGGTYVTTTETDVVTFSTPAAFFTSTPRNSVILNGLGEVNHNAAGNVTWRLYIGGALVFTLNCTEGLTQQNKSGTFCLVSARKPADATHIQTNMAFWGRDGTAIYSMAATVDAATPGPGVNAVRLTIQTANATNGGRVHNAQVFGATIDPTVLT